MPLPTLYFTPYAWAKMMFMRDKESGLEVGAFGVSNKDTMNLVEDIILPKQEVTGSTVEFDEKELPGFYEDMVDLGYGLQQFSRIWIHTHPFDGATPSGTDETTFKSVFGNNDWAIMFILAKTGKVTSRLSINQSGFSFSTEIQYGIHWKNAFPGSNQDLWAAEYDKNVTQRKWTPPTYNGSYYVGGNSHGGSGYHNYGNVQYSGMHQRHDDDDYYQSRVTRNEHSTHMFAKERALIERATEAGMSKKNYADSKGGFGDKSNDRDSDDADDWNQYQKLDTVLEDDPPFSVQDDIPWIAD